MRPTENSIEGDEIGLKRKSTLSLMKIKEVDSKNDVKFQDGDYMDYVNKNMYPKDGSSLLDQVFSISFDNREN